MLHTQSGKIIIGIDEAGRGPLAGPVYAAACCLDKNFPYEILNDSKKLSETKRLYAEKTIKEKALAWAVAFATTEEIELFNILNASLLAMKRAFELILPLLHEKNIKPDSVLIDGNIKPPINFECEAIVKGDTKIYEIMAASILAKTERDRIMTEYAKKWPQYGFEKHKGYPTKAHFEALKLYGPCEIHRKTFNGVFYQH